MTIALRAGRWAALAITLTAVAVLDAPAALAASPCGSTGTFTINAPAGTVTCTYSTTGATTFTVPSSVTSVSVAATGGQGGTGGYNKPPGGYGAIVTES